MQLQFAGMQPLWDWLKNPEFETGVELYNQAGGSDALKFLFSQGKNSYSMERLISAIRELAENPQTIQAPVSPAPFKLDPQLPDDIKAIKTQDWELYLEAKRLHEQLKVEGQSQESRLEKALKIQEIFELKADLYQKINYWNIHGKLPEVPKLFDFSSWSVADLLKRKNSVKTYISPNRKISVEKKALYVLEFNQIEEVLKARGA